MNRRKSPVSAGKPRFRPLSYYAVAAAALSAVSALSFAAAPAYAQPKAARPPAVGKGPAPAVPIDDEAIAKAINGTPDLVRQMRAIQEDKKQRTPTQRKIAAAFIYAARVAQGQPQIPSRPDMHLRTYMETDAKTGLVRATIKGAVTPALLNAIKSAGGQMLYSSVRYKTIYTLLPILQVEPLAARSDISVIHATQSPKHNTGAVNSQGDGAHQSDLARSTFGLTGANVKVGVVSTDLSYVAQSKASGDIENLTVAVSDDGTVQDGLDPFLNPQTGDGEGTAMLEIVHDLAPDSPLYYATGFYGEAIMADNIRLLYDKYGVNIITDDIFYFDEPAYQDGMIADAVNYVKSKGVDYYSSAGNAGNAAAYTSSVWEGDYREVLDTVTGVPFVPVNRFAPGAMGTYNTVLENTTGIVSLNWADPYGAAVNDFDVYMVDSGGANVVGGSFDDQPTTGDPFEICFGDVDQRIYIYNYNAQPVALHLNTFGSGFGPSLTYTTTGQTHGHSSAAGSYSVAATPAQPFNVLIPFTQPFFAPVPEDFSSDGPRRMFLNFAGQTLIPGSSRLLAGGQFVTRQKPDITAADGVTTTVPGFIPFFGTSAAAPHAAAIGSLIRSYQGLVGGSLVNGPGLTEAEFNATLLGTAVTKSLYGNVPDITSGYGVIDAYGALDSLVNFVKPTIKNISATQTRIEWTTNLPAKSTLVFGEKGITGPGTITYNDNVLTTKHAVTFRNLKPHTVYHYSFKANTPTNSVVYQSPGDPTFVTSGQTDTTTLAVKNTGNNPVPDAPALHSGNNLIVSVSIINTGTGVANQITITSATLAGVAATTPFPFVAGNGLYPGGTLPVPITFAYPTGRAVGSLIPISVTGTLANGAPFSGTATVILP